MEITALRSRCREVIFTWLRLRSGVMGQTPPMPALRLCIIKPTGFSGLFRECHPCFSRHYRFSPLKKANRLNDALVERRSWRGLHGAPPQFVVGVADGPATVERRRSEPFGRAVAGRLTSGSIADGEQS